MVVFLLALVPVSANSALVTWQIDVQLPEGGTVTGSFVYDASTNLFTDVNVSAAGEPFDTLSLPAGSSASLTSVIDFESNANNIDLVPTNGDLTNVTDVFVELDNMAGGMTDAGGIITVNYVSIDAMRKY